MPDPRPLTDESAWQAWYEPELDIGRYMSTSRYGAMRKAFTAGWDAAATALAKRLEHAEAALAGDNEGCRLWMLDCSETAERQRQRIAQLEGVLTEVLAHFTEHGHPGYRAVRTPWLMTGFVQQWRDALSHSTTTTGDPS